MKQETLPIVDCGAEILDALTRQHLDDLEAKGCKFETYFHALKLIEDGKATSRRDAARQTADETGEHPAKVESEVRRAEAKIKQAMEAELARKEAESGECVTDDADGDSLEPLVYVPPVDKITEDREKLRKKYGPDHSKDGPLLLEEIGDTVPAEYEEYKEICDLLDLPLPTTHAWSAGVKFRSPEDTITHLLRVIFSLPAKPKPRVAVDGFFAHHAIHRKNCRLCWWCLDRRPKTKEFGLCASCSDTAIKWQMGAKGRAKIKKRGINDKSTKAWTEILDKSNALDKEIETLLQKENKINAELAEELRESFWAHRKVSDKPLEVVAEQDNTFRWDHLRLKSA